MCLSPLIIRNKSPYYYPSVSALPSHYEVPCGKCDECRNFYMSEWRTRISYEIDSLYKRGGKAIFLTFTYNDAHLPSLSCNGVTIPAFSHSDVKTFLNKIKVWSNRTYGKKAYKYFFTSEYGSTTKRPHYHALFFLEERVDPCRFAEQCRQYWLYGFMFPKYQKGVGYVGNHGESAPILIKSLVGGAKYVSKYVTKDLSYFDDELVQRALAPFFVRKEDFVVRDGSTIVEYSYNFVEVDPKLTFKDRLPKHWQSNGLGSSMLANIKPADYSSLLSKGIFNPLTMQFDALPQFVSNKLMYKNVPSERRNADGKILYDRQLSDFGVLYLSKVFDVKCKRVVDNYTSFASTYMQYVRTLKDVGLSLFDVDAVLSKVGDLHEFARWFVSYRFAPDCQILHNIFMHEGDMSMALCYDSSFEYFKLSKDLVYQRKYPPQKYKVLATHNPLYERIVAFRSLVSLYKLCTSTLKSDDYFYKAFVDAGIQQIKRFYAIYDKTLC